MCFAGKTPIDPIDQGRTDKFVIWSLEITGRDLAGHLDGGGDVHQKRENSP
jgi:hypothetical protein